VSFALTGPVSQAIGVDATFIVAGIAGGVATIAFLFIPGIRDTEKDGRMKEPAPDIEDEDEVLAS
jgi:hypothetical protein